MNPTLSSAPLSPARRAGIGFVFLWFFLGGIGHFVATGFFASIVPPSIPWPRLAVYVSGVFELLGAFALLSPRLRPLAGWGLIALIICVTPANVYMWQHPDLFPTIPSSLLGFRLVLQVLLIACVWWSTRTPATLELR